MQPDAQPVQPITSSQPVSQSVNVKLDSQGHKKVGPIIATLVIVLVLIIAALYLFASRLSDQPVPEGSTDQSVATDIQSLQEDLTNSTVGLDEQNF